MGSDCSGDSEVRPQHSNATATPKSASSPTKQPKVWPALTADETKTKARFVEHLKGVVDANPILVVSKSWCPYCRELVVAMHQLNVPDFKVLEVDHLKLTRSWNLDDQNLYMQAVQEVTGEHLVPQLFVDSQYQGEYGDLYDEPPGQPAVLKPAVLNRFKAKAEPALSGEFDFDLFVLGGGSGGVAAAFEAAKHEGVRVAVADFVNPAWGPHGTTWGVGGTCVNVGCIPKKLMHIAATIGEVNQEDAASFGWEMDTPKFCWEKLCEGVQGYITKQLNAGTLEGFKQNNITYYNKYATLHDRHTIHLTSRGLEGEDVTVRAKYILLAAGGRPSDGGYEGAELCISSDDLFWLEKPPGKTLIVGAAYIALECGGMLRGMGMDVTVMVRSILLRGFDRECVDKIGAYMEHHGTSFQMQAVPQKFVKGSERAVRCYYMQGDDTEPKFEEFDTVLLAVGRTGEAAKLGLENAGVVFNPTTGKVDAPCERTNVPNIYAIGDLVEDRLELTPVAKMAGKKVVQRLFSQGTEAMDYTKIATTVFTPLEYGMVGLTEEEAQDKYGSGLQAIRKDAAPLEWALSRDNEATKAFFKVLVDSSTRKIVGFHMLGPNAGEVLQGVALAIKAGATIDQLDETIGIHPTTAETMTLVSADKISEVACAT